ncbi:MAG: methyltransferase domain-containing protein [Acidimicrobiales bacterium]
MAVGERDFDALIEEASREPTDGWDFSWLDGRATEERPSWGYARLLAQRIASCTTALDLQTGGGEVLSEVLAATETRPDRVVATEGWPPNAVLARGRLTRFGVDILEIADSADVPCESNFFDLVTSRHPSAVRWDEIARVLRPGGTYFAQHVGAGSNRALGEFIHGPLPVNEGRTPASAVTQAEAVGLAVVDIREEWLQVEFLDVGAVTYFLRKVVWTVPGFDVTQSLERLRQLHDVIQQEGRFVSHASRFLIEARRP